MQEGLQSPSPGRQSVAGGQAAPLPLGAADCCHVLVQAYSHAAVQSLHEPAQSMSGGQSSVPAIQSSTSPCRARHGMPFPLTSVVITYVFSHAALQALQSPTQSASQVTVDVNVPSSHEGCQPSAVKPAAQAYSQVAP